MGKFVFDVVRAGLDGALTGCHHVDDPANRGPDADNREDEDDEKHPGGRLG